MMMVEVNSIDAVPGEAELLAFAADYMAARLFTPRQHKNLSVLIDVTKEPLRVPVTRSMLGRQKTGLVAAPPTLFEMTVSTAFGVRDAAETIAHEMLHISQAVNERLLITKKTTKIAGRKTELDLARWMGGKPVVIDNLHWHLRPWEIEACHWQEHLVDEFLNLATGQATEQPIQSAKRRQLALYPVKIASPAFVPTKPEPDFDGVTATGGGGVSSQAIASERGSAERQEGTDVTPPDQIMPDQIMPDQIMPDQVLPDGMLSAPPRAEISQPEEAPANLNPADLNPADLTQMDQVSPVAPSGRPANDDTQLPNARSEDRSEDRSENGVPLAAMPDRPVYPRPVYPRPVHPEPVHPEPVHPEPVHPEPVLSEPVLSEPVYPQDRYPRPVIEVTVPGLDGPRALTREAMIRKLSEFRQRGLAVIEEAG
jgi:hypothetical protein